MDYSAIITTIPSRKELLKRSLNSVVNQKLRPREIIIVVDGTAGQGDQFERAVYEKPVDNKDLVGNQMHLYADRIHNLAKEHRCEIRIIPSQGKGISAARNSGIKEARNPWLAFLDDDDEWTADKMRFQAELIERENKTDNKKEAPRYRLCHCNEKWLKNNSHLNQMKKHKKSGGRIYARCLELCCISPSAVVTHKTLFEDYGLFDEKMPVCEDFDMWLRISAYEKVLFIDKPLVVKYGGHKQLSKRYWGMDRFRIYAAQKMLANEKLDPDYRLASVVSIRRRLNILIMGAAKRNKKIYASYYQILLADLEKNNPRDIYCPRLRNGI